VILDQTIFPPKTNRNLPVYGQSFDSGRLNSDERMRSVDGFYQRLLPGLPSG
jgi:hypothetical protein